MDFEATIYGVPCTLHVPEAYVTINYPRGTWEDVGIELTAEQRNGHPALIPNIDPVIDAIKSAEARGPAPPTLPVGLQPMAASVIHMEVLTMSEEELLAAHLTLAESLRDMEDMPSLVGLLQLVVQERNRRRMTYRVVVVS